MNMNTTPITLRLISPYEAMAVPTAIKTTAEIRRGVGVSSPAANSANMVTIGVNACQSTPISSKGNNYPANNAARWIEWGLYIIWTIWMGVWTSFEQSEGDKFDFLNLGSQMAVAVYERRIDISKEAGGGTSRIKWLPHFLYVPLRKERCFTSNDRPRVKRPRARSQPQKQGKG
jgi:hypothetical protein